MGYTQALADYAVDLKYDDLPQEVIEQAKMLTLHTIGVALAGLSTEQAQKAIALAKKMSGEGTKSTVWGDGVKLSCVNAAFANGIMSDVLDWEDCGWTGHPSANLIPAAFAVGESIGASGKDYITAVVTGFEVYQRIAMAIQPSDNWDPRRGWGLVSWGIFASSLSAAKLLKLSKNDMAHTIGNSAALSLIVTPKTHFSDLYHYMYGVTCQNGIIAALLAQSGMNPSPVQEALDGDDGYWISMSDQCRWDWYTKGLGKDYLIMDTLFKHWPANMWVQSPLDAVDTLVKEHKIRIDDIREILITPHFGRRMAYKPEGFSGVVQAEFSIPYCLAAYLLYPKPGPNWFKKESLRDPRILELASKVQTEGLPLDVIHDCFSKFQAGGFPEVTAKITLKDERQFKKVIVFPKGHPKNRFTHEEYGDNFGKRASFVLKPKNIETTIEKLMNLEKVDNVTEIAALLHR